MAVAPSRIARRVAGDLWPEVQAQYKVAPGTFGFSCAGHGGLVCVLNAAPHVSAEVAARAREFRMVELAAFGSRRILTTAQGYTADSLRRWGEQPGHELRECWVGEEDCEWAVLASSSEAIRLGMAESGYFSRVESREEVLSVVETWSPRWLGITPEPARLNPGEAFMRAAWGEWHERVPAGKVGVVVDDETGRETYGLVPRAAYENTEQRGSHPETHRRVIDVRELAPCAAF